MRDHQKYFALEDASGKLLPHFLAVLNTDRRSRRAHPPRQRARAARPLQRRALLLGDRPEDSAARARGHAEGGDLPERPGQLLRQDDARAEAGQPDLGGDSQRRRLRCVRASSSRPPAVQDRPDDRTGEGVHRVARHHRRPVRARCRSSIRYARARRHEAIGDAIYDHYKPESMDDSVPRSVEGGVLAIADKADSIAGMFALGLQPTGSKDPVRAAPRRQRHREDHRRAQAAAADLQAVCRCARRVCRLGSRAALRSEDVKFRRGDRDTSCASGWSSICAMCAASPTTW